MVNNGAWWIMVTMKNMNQPTIPNTLEHKKTFENHQPDLVAGKALLDRCFERSPSISLASACSCSIIMVCSWRRLPWGCRIFPVIHSWYMYRCRKSLGSVDSEELEPVVLAMPPGCFRINWMFCHRKCLDVSAAKTRWKVVDVLATDAERCCTAWT